MPPFNDALRTLDSHEERIQRVEEELREHAAEIAGHRANLDRINEVFDLKMKLVMDAVQTTQKNVAEGNAALASKVDGYFSQITPQIHINSGRIEKLEVMRQQQDARWKWIKASLSTLLVGGVGYGIQQVLAKLLLHK